MKRILIVAFIVMFSVALNNSSVEASISVTKDSFRNENNITSDSRSKPFTQVLFMKFFNQSGNSNGYLMGLTMFTSKEWWFFSGNSIDVKIDDTIYTIPVVETTSKYVEESRPLSLRTAITINPDIVIGHIKNAKTVIFRVGFENQPYFDWTVPQKVLAEWQTVINLDKDGKPINLAGE